MLRQFMLRQGRRMSAEQLQALSRKKAGRAVRSAAQNSRAYRALLREQGLDPASLDPETSWADLPVLTKTSTFGRFSLDELARPFRTAELADVLTSSGRGGNSFGYRLTSRDIHEESWFDIDLGLQDVFEVDQRSTLLVNCLPMGVVFRSRAVTVANVSVREDMACSILRDIGPKFDQTIVCTDPMFVRQLLHEGERAGVNWAALNTSLIMGEEMLVESQRDYIAARMGLDLDHEPHRLIGSSYGVGELGLNLLFETRETIRIRRAIRTAPDLRQKLGLQAAEVSLPSVFCFNPLRTHVEVLNPDENGFGELCVTMLDSGAVIALPRFATGDVGRLVSNGEAQQLGRAAGAGVPWLPMVLVQGRQKDRPAGMPSVEAVKEALYQNAWVADQLTGAFRLSVGDGGRIRLSVQTHEPSANLQAALAERLDANGMGDLELTLCPVDAFAWRPLLDFERKFAYL